MFVFLFVGAYLLGRQFRREHPDVAVSCIARLASRTLSGWMNAMCIGDWKCHMHLDCPSSNQLLIPRWQALSTPGGQASQQETNPDEKMEDHIPKQQACLPWEIAAKQYHARDKHPPAQLSVSEIR